MANYTALQKMSLDVYKGVPVVFNNVSGEDALRNKITETIGGEWNYYNFQRNKIDFYELMSELLVLPTQEIMGNIFGGIVSVETVPLGTKKVIDVQDENLFKVATVAAGNSDIRRQRVFNRQITVDN